MNQIYTSNLPSLPLLLWETPPGLDLILAQEGIPCSRVQATHPLAFQRGRFVLYDGRRIAASRVRATLTPDHVALDIDLLRQEDRRDPFQALVDTRAAHQSWQVTGLALTERAGRIPKAGIRRRIVQRLRHAVGQAGGLWVRLSAFPFPYRSAFNFRADLDESVPDDYARFARARRPLEDCTTHFVSTRAYGEHPAVLTDLLRFDSQSHGHHHVIYRDPAANRRNLRRAHRTLAESGMTPVGFAAPHGRWNAGLDEVLEELGYLYSSDFQLGFDDLPFFPWLGDRFSTVLQIPIHPVCEGLFIEAGADNGRAVAQYLARVVRSKINACEPAFVYGHPERRLARFPEVLAELAAVIANEPYVWRATLTDFAQWWRWRAERRWSVLPKPEGRFEIQFDDWSGDFPMAVEIVRGQHVATVPVTGPRTIVHLEDLAYERREVRADLPAPTVVRRTPSLKSAVRKALDWETVTPLADLPSSTLTDRVKKGLRWWRDEPNGRDTK
ncbi:polysaccharide deacetylase family protein [Singulisphaera acidiphila]|uniref:Uncharacterized protein n=1 Tax=Singulisphaera acidiphila (strain ATCC BAA-1392 / DSM 18658 / VKM B-2454 / MOB10) TaxID=886293 RepID=L0DDB2_SINAD|nr:hypothetical protein [Singulisphaera acidiphila]AGA27242.1 hypothetical protein Sinac_2958 [Singulisphaera acidiphila DSM 18658]